jgi:hypothetical protein
MQPVTLRHMSSASAEGGGSSSVLRPLALPSGKFAGAEDIRRRRHAITRVSIEGTGNLTLGSEVTPGHRIAGHFQLHVPLPPGHLASLRT